MKTTTNDGRREETPWPDRPIGPGLKLTWKLVFGFLDAAVDFWDGVEARRRQRELDRRRAACWLAIREERESAVEMARRTGGALAALKHVEGAHGWVRDVRAMGLNEESACQRVALFYFAKAWPTVYARSLYLGLPKMFQIVRAQDEVVLKLLPDVPVRRNGHAVTVLELTDTDYRDYVNRLLREAARPTSAWERADRASRDAARLVLRLRAADVPQGAGVEELQVRLTAASAYLKALPPP